MSAGVIEYKRACLIVVSDLIHLAAYRTAKDEFTKANYAVCCAPYVGVMAAVAKELKEVCESQFVAHFPESDQRQGIEYFLLSWFVDYISLRDSHELEELADSVYAAEILGD